MHSYAMGSYQGRPTYHLISMDDGADNWQSDSRIAAPSNPYANLAQRALLRCQINALKNIIPDLVEPAGLPQGAIDLSDGYVLLRKRDTTARPLLPTENLTLNAYLEAQHGTRSQFSVIRWGRLRLPTGQIARSLWVESKPLERLRMARNIKVSINFYSTTMAEPL